ncbi:NAD(P)/FAD-dependent oxidoreductase [Pengzhenrongella sicca]|uniref:NAD(P)/FAD-dependent oxidoreductase n=1 Tax=Pengzhenrongella sicca TaxID=2819238 RepID=A0A8A4ZHW6_9MICO|nr:NAD(P)/FAD-dependent oxidoreductase [Pengzhenrongella sicca]QTE30981.1 NAD(P)/FAD-dependent oxidoreductase [Pengzhenrongella sicca]
MTSPTNSPHDVVIVGGGTAGLSAAVTLARSLRDVVVIDAGEPRNAPAAGAHNLLGREGIPPLELLEAGRREALAYGAQIHRGRASTARRTADGFELTLADGATVTARRLLLATGLVDELPDVPGVRELWGTQVLHCPYCHGYEVRGTRIGVIATGSNAVHQTLLLRQLSADVTLFLHEGPEPDDEAWDQLAALGVTVVIGQVRELARDGDRLRAVVLADGHSFAVDAVAVQPRFVARGDLYEQIGGTQTENPMGRHLTAGPTGATELPGVWAAGNAGDLSAMVGASAAQGVLAGAAINADLVMADVRVAVRERADRARVVGAGAAAGTNGLAGDFSPVMEARVAELVLGDRRHGFAVDG